MDTPVNSAIPQTSFSHSHANDNGTHSKQFINLIATLSAIILGILVALAAGYHDNAEARCHLGALFLLRAIISAALLLITYKGVEAALQGHSYHAKEPSSRVIARLFPIHAQTAKTVVMLAIFTLLCWIPYLALMYPGNLSNDTSGQIAMFFAFMEGSNAVPLSNHHPIFDTFVFGALIYGANSLFHNMHFSLAILIILQMACTALTLSYATVHAHYKWAAPQHACFYAQLFFALFPVFPLITTSLSKDTFFGWLYILFFIAIVDMLFERGQPIERIAPFIAKLTVLCILMALTKQLGGYIAIGSLLFCILFAEIIRKLRALLVIPVILTLALMWMVTPAMLATFNIAPSGEQEVLAIPLQQSALTYNRHSEEIPINEKEVLGACFAKDLDVLPDVYNPYSADPIKGYGQYGRSFDGYVTVWINQGIRYPQDYFDAWAALESPLLSDAIIQPVFNSNMHSWDPGYLDKRFYEKGPFFDKASTTLNLLYDWLSHLPVLNILFMPTLYVIIIPWLFFLLALGGDTNVRNRLLMLAPSMCVLLGLLVSPTVRECAETMRYIIPCLYSAPLLLTLIVEAAHTGPTSSEPTGLQLSV